MARLFTATVLTAALGATGAGCRCPPEPGPELTAPGSRATPGLKRFLMGSHGPPGHVMRAAGSSDFWMQGEYSEPQAARWGVPTLPEVTPSEGGWQARLVVYQPAAWEGGRESRPARIVVMRGTLGEYPQVLWEEERVLEEGAYVNRLYWGEN